MVGPSISVASSVASAMASPVASSMVSGRASLNQNGSEIVDIGPGRARDDALAKCLKKAMRIMLVEAEGRS